MRRFLIVLVLALLSLSGFPHIASASQLDGGASGSSIASDSVNETHIDWGTGTNQVSQDDVPDGATFKQYDPTSVGITGGTINGTVIGGITPAAGTFAPLSVGKSDGTAGENETIYATLTDIHNFTSVNWNEDGVTWTMGASGPLVHVTGNTTPVTATLTESPVVGTGYIITITGTGGGGTATYTFGGVTGTTIAASGAIAIVDHITAVTTAGLVITPANGCTVSLSAVNVKKKTLGTGDLTVQGKFYAKSQIVLPFATPQLSIPGYPTSGLGVSSSGNIISYSSGTAVVNLSGSFMSLTDTNLHRQAANHFIQRVSVNQQIFSVANTYTDASNYEYQSFTGVAGASFNWTAATLGTGGDNLDMIIIPAGTGAVKAGATGTAPFQAGATTLASLTGTAITDSTSTTSSTVAASATGVKAAYDLASGKQDALTYPVTGVISPTAGMLTKWGASGNTLADGLKFGTVTDTKWCSYSTAAGLTCIEDAPAGSGDVQSAGDCLGGACYNGSSGGGTYIALYDGDSNWTKIVAGNTAANLTFTTPTAYPAGTYLMSSTIAGALGYVDPATFVSTASAAAYTEPGSNLPLCRTGAGTIGACTNLTDLAFSSYVDKALYDAYSILYATTDNTPAALTVTEQTVVGRVTGGAIAALAIDADLTTVSANDDTVPSAKATKAMGDLKAALAGTNAFTGANTIGDAGDDQVVKLNVNAGDGTFSGFTITRTVATGSAAESFGQAMFVESDGELAAADADATTSMPAICILVTAGEGANKQCLTHGTVTETDWNWTPGAILYVSTDPTTTTGLTATAPSGTGDQVQAVAVALSADTIMVNPSLVLVEVP